MPKLALWFDESNPQQLCLRRAGPFAPADRLVLVEVRKEDTNYSLVKRFVEQSDMLEVPVPDVVRQWLDKYEDVKEDDDGQEDNGSGGGV